MNDLEINQIDETNKVNYMERLIHEHERYHQINQNNSNSELKTYITRDVLQVNSKLNFLTF